MDTLTIMAIGGLDPSGGAGLLADALTIVSLGARAQAVATAITAQSARRVSRFVPLSPQLAVAQAEQLFDDDPPQAVKLGMLGDAKIARALAKLLAHRLGRRPLVIDPVLKASSGATLFRGHAGRDYADLFAEARVITPNLAEAAHLLGEPIGPASDQRADAARELSRLLRCAVVLKGGHALADADDLVAEDGEVHTLRAKRVPVQPGAHRRGTGCRFAATLATQLARGDDLLSATRAAKAYVRRYLTA
jgi:hydroxymethylpyrimidine/phosphomethylpyrimidine kinase